MSIPSVPQPWRVADAVFVEVELRQPSDRQMRVEFGCGLRLVITDASQVLWQTLEKLPRHQWPTFSRGDCGDCGYGSEAIMLEHEERGLPYLFKLL